MYELSALNFDDVSFDAPMYLPTYARKERRIPQSCLGKAIPRRGNCNQRGPKDQRMPRASAALKKQPEGQYG